MKILQKYITRNLITATLVSLLGLVCLFSFFSIIDQLADTGRGNYNVVQALTYVFLTTPKLAYELFPVAAVIGSMVTLGSLARHSELVVIRSSGLSKTGLAFLLSRAAVVLVILSIIIGEFIAPFSEETAQNSRSLAMTEQISNKTEDGYWARDGDSFINIGKVLPNNQVEEIYIYEFDKDNKLRSSIYAKEGRYENQRWVLDDLEQTSISSKGISTKKYKRAEWPSLLDPEMINFTIVQPRYLSFFGLLKYIGYLKQNAQETIPYEQALWIKIVKPFSIWAMILLSVLLVQSETRFTPVGQRVFLGMLIGIIFHIVDQIAGHVGIVYNVNPFVSVAAPTILLLTTALYLIRE